MATKEINNELNIAYKASDIASYVGGVLDGDEDVVVTGLSRIDHPERDTLTYYSDSRYSAYLDSDVRRVMLIKQVPDDVVRSTIFIVTDDPQEAMFKASELFDRRTFEGGRADTAVIADSAEIANGVSIGHFTTIGRETRVGGNSVISDQVYIGARCEIGDRVVLYPGVRIMDDTIIGNDVIIHPNAVIGSDGFGYRFFDGQYIKIPHIGNVIIEDDVEIGANTCIDRAAVGSTVIKQGVKLDNLIQIAHNVEIGENTAIAAQAGVSGSAKVGKYVRIGGQTGVVGHIQIADGSQIQAQSGVASDLSEPGQKWYGYPAMNYWGYLRSFSIFKKLPKLLARIEALEKRAK